MFLQASAKEGYDWAIVTLGRDYLSGSNGVEKDVNEGIKWLEKSESPEAKYYLGEAYIEKGEYELALYYINQATKVGIEAENLIADSAKERLKELFDTLYETVIFGDIFEGTLYETIIEKTQSDSMINVSQVDANYLIGVCYYNGYYVEEDREEAAKWWLWSAEKGHMDAQGKLGNCYIFGRGVEPDLEKGLYWWQKCADQGNRETQNEIKKLFVHFSTNAQTSTNAKYGLGICYYYGYATNIDKNKAISLMREAASQGSLEAKEFMTRYTEDY